MVVHLFTECCSILVSLAMSATDAATLGQVEALVQRMNTARVEFRLVVDRLSIDSYGPLNDDDRVATLLEMRDSEGAAGTFDAASAIVDALIVDLRDAPVVHGVTPVIGPSSYRIARSEGRVLQELFAEPAVTHVQTRTVTLSYLPSLRRLDVGEPSLGTVMLFEPSVVLQPLPSGDTATAWSAGDWVEIVDGVYRCHYDENDLFRRRATVRTSEGGLPLGYWVRPRHERESMLMGLYLWAHGDDGSPHPAGAVFVSRSGGHIVVVRYRVSDWLEPAPVSASRLAVPRSIGIFDGRGDSHRRVPSVDDLDSEVRDAMVIAD